MRYLPLRKFLKFQSYSLINIFSLIADFIFKMVRKWVSPIWSKLYLSSLAINLFIDYLVMNYQNTDVTVFFIPTPLFPTCYSSLYLSPLSRHFPLLCVLIPFSFYFSPPLPTPNIIRSIPGPSNCTRIRAQVSLVENSMQWHSCRFQSASRYSKILFWRIFSSYDNNLEWHTQLM